MSKERDLLVSCLDEFQYHEVPCSDLIRTIRWILNEPEHIVDVTDMVEQEPVAWMYEWVDEVGEPVKSVVYNFYEGANLIPLYTAPPKREPLTPQQISEGNQSMLNVTREAFKQGVRFAEKAHGIGGGE
jgi:hypothetical protein